MLTDTGRAAEPPARAKAQRALLDTLRAAPQSRDALRAQKQSRHAAALVETGWATWARLPPDTGDVPRTAAAPAATPEQQAALDTLLPTLGQFGVHLIHGVTGSGKTELYLRLIDAVLAAGRQVLVLVPEINLTPQLEQHFRRRFPGAPLARLHSGLAETASARRTGWRRARRARIVLGTRLSVFAPLPRLGLIVVDEEHDASFKQQDGLRYSARDVAICARATSAAFPSCSARPRPRWRARCNAQSGRYRLLEADAARRSAGRSLPDSALHRHATRLPSHDGLSEPLLHGARRNAWRAASRAWSSSTAAAMRRC